jgi:hypothetical protein
MLFSHEQDEVLAFAAWVEQEYVNEISQTERQTPHVLTHVCVTISSESL